MNIQQAVELASSLMPIPAGYEPQFMQTVLHDTEPVIWLRFKKIGTSGEWGGEHFSITFNPEEKKIKGFMHLEEQFDTDIVPTENEAERLAFEFLNAHAADLIDTVEVRWIRPLRKEPISPPHDEGFMLNSGKIITGMRVKFFIHANGKYSWVIAGKGGKLISFERDITWDTGRKCRATQKWLHDNWVKQQNVSLMDGPVIA